MFSRNQRLALFALGLAVVLVLLISCASPEEVESSSTTIQTAPMVGMPTCDPNYTGCVPSLNMDPIGDVDVDCREAGEDGPLYTGRVQVLGDDPYDLDPDGDRVACE